MRPLSAAIEARYPGTCAECNEDILAGDLIARSQIDTWIHVEHFDNLGVR